MNTQCILCVLYGFDEFIFIILKKRNFQSLHESKVQADVLVHNNTSVLKVKGAKLPFNMC